MNGMKKNRYIPFGYELRNGAVTINPTEVDVVRLVYELYADGAGYNAIAERLTAVGAIYHEGAAWNKHMVKRILENARYTGADGYPVIIGTDFLGRVAAMKAANPHCKTPKRREPDEPEADDLIIAYIPSQSVRRLNNELNRSLEKNNSDLGQIRSLIFSCAAEKYTSLIGVKQNG